MKLNDVEQLISASETACRQAAENAEPNHVPSIPEKINLLELKKTFAELKSILAKHRAADNDPVLSAALIQELTDFLKTRDARVTRYGGHMIGLSIFLGLSVQLLNKLLSYSTIAH